MKDCIRCGAALEDSAEQCRYCGKNLAEDKDTPDTQAQQTQQAEQGYQPPRYPDPPVYDESPDNPQKAPQQQGYQQQPGYQQQGYRQPNPQQQYQPPNYQQPNYQQSQYQPPNYQPPNFQQPNYPPPGYQAPPPGAYPQQYQQPYDSRAPHGYNYYYYTEKSKVAAGVLGILLGGLGVHKFYLGNIGLGIVYLLFAWTCIPSIIGLIEGIIYLTMDDYAFREKYCKVFR